MEGPGRTGSALSGLFHELSYAGHFLECPTGTARPPRARRPQPNLDSYCVSRHRGGHAVFYRPGRKLYAFARRLGSFLAESSAVGTDALGKLAVRDRARPPAKGCELPGAACHRVSPHTRA